MERFLKQEAKSTNHGKVGKKGTISKLRISAQ